MSFFGNKLDKDKEIDNAVKLTTTVNMPVEYLMANIGFEPFEVMMYNGRINEEAYLFNEQISLDNLIFARGSLFVLGS